MNIRNVLNVYAKLRNFTDDESALLETLRAMNETERELFVETLGPQRTGGKKSAKKSSSKSKKAASLQRQIQGRATGSKDRCVFSLQTGDDKYETCDAVENDPIHDETFGYAGYHPFSPAASSAPPPSTPASSETRQGDKATVASGD